MSNCKEFHLLASLVIDGEASEAEQAELTAHMEACPACRAYFEDIRRIHESFTREEARLPEGFALHVMDRVRETAQDRPQGKQHVISFPYWRQWAALAACCAIVALGVWRFQSQEGHLEAGQMARSASIPAAAGGAAALPEAEAEDAAPAMEEAEDAALAADPPASSGAADAGVSRNTGSEAQKAADPEAAYTSNAEPSLETAPSVRTDSALPEEQLSPSYSGALEADAPLGEEAGLLTADASAGAALTQEQVLEIALGEVPGATANDVTKLELDRDDGVQIYEVKISYNGMKYELEISAADGTILEYECEKDSGRHGRH